MAQFILNAITENGKTFHAVTGMVNGQDKTYKVTSKTFRTNIDGVKGPVVDYTVDPQAYADAMIEQYNYQASKKVDSPVYETFTGPVSGKVRKLVPAFSTTIDNKKVKFDLSEMDPEDFMKALDEHYVALAEKSRANEASLTPEQKAERSEKAKAAYEARLAAMTPEEREAHNATIEANAQKQREKYASLSPEERATLSEKAKADYEARLASMTPEELEAHNATIEANAQKQREKHASLSPEERAALSEKAKADYEARLTSMTPEERDALHQKQVAQGKAAYEAQDKDAFAAAVEANRQNQIDARAAMTPEELEAERERGRAAAEAALDLSGIELPSVDGPTL